MIVCCNTFPTYAEENDEESTKIEENMDSEELETTEESPEIVDEQTNLNNLENTVESNDVNPNDARHLISYQTHVQDLGWLDRVYDGETGGTTGKSKRLEALNINLIDTSYTGVVEYSAHVQDIGWQDWVSNGNLSGTIGQGKRVEAIKIKLSGDISNYYDIYYRVHAANFGWLGWTKNGEAAGTSGYSYHLEAIEIQLVEKNGSAPEITENAFHHPLVKYATHIENDGWQGWKNDGELSGTTGRALRLEGIKIMIPDQDYEGSICYKTHVQDYGWQDWTENGEMSGTSGKELRLEAIQIRLTGEMEANYDIYYQVHAEEIGWMGWAKNGGSAGTAGYGYRLEAIRIQLVPKDGEAPGSATNPFKSPMLSYSSHVEQIGWQAAVSEGQTSGTSGKGYRLEAIKITSQNQEYSGGIRYRTHVQDIGWQDWIENGQISGTSGRGLRLEAIQIQLTGELEEYYDVYYRVHSEDYGWMYWMKNGQQAGSVGRGKRLEAIQIKLLPKNESISDVSQPVWASSNLANRTNQILIVNANGGTSVNIQLWEKNEGLWSKAMETSGFVGSDGIGTASDYISKTPAGAYALGYAFGMHGNPGCRLDYRRITHTSYWIGTMWDPQYNTWQERTSGTSWDEHLIEYSQAYEYAMTFDYNRGPGGGSAFFLHVSNGRPTAGCISLPRANMIYLMRNIQKGAYIAIINQENEMYSL